MNEMQNCFEEYLNSEEYKEEISINNFFNHPENQIWCAFIQGYKAAQHSVHLTALRRGLALSLLFNVILLAVVLATIGGR